MSDAAISCRALPGGFSVALEAPQRILDGFDLLFHAFARAPHAQHASIRLRASQSLPSGWTIFVDDLRAASFEAPEMIAPFLETMVCQFLILQRADRIPIHASGVARSGMAILMPGEKGSGKSTLSLWLATRGFAYLGDELLWIDPSEGVVEPFPKAAAIKEGAFDLFESAGVFQSPTRGPLRYFLPASYSTDACPVERILFPCFNREQPFGVHPLQPEEALLYLSRMLFGGLARRPERFPALLRMATLPASLAIYRDAREIEDYLNSDGGPA